eukprot:7415065-Pyramimonas_sp.AAC.1
MCAFQAYVLQGNAYLQLRLFSDALRAYEEGLSIFPSNDQLIAGALQARRQLAAASSLFVYPVLGCRLAAHQRGNRPKALSGSHTDTREGVRTNININITLMIKVRYCTTSLDSGPTRIPLVPASKLNVLDVPLCIKIY